MRVIQHIILKLSGGDLCWECKNCLRVYHPLTCKYGIGYEEDYTLYMPDSCENFQLCPSFFKRYTYHYLRKIQHWFLKIGWNTYSKEERRKKGAMPYTIKFSPTFIESYEHTSGQTFPEKLRQIDGRKYLDAKNCKL